MRCPHKRIILIGPSPTQNTDPNNPLSPSRESRSTGSCLLRLTNMDPDSFQIAFDRHYLIPIHQGRHRGGDRYPRLLAKQAANRMLNNLKGRMVVLIGTNVARTFGIHSIGPFVWVDNEDVLMAWVPHPSGRNLWWNNPTNKQAGEAFLTELGQRAFELSLKALAA